MVQTDVVIWQFRTFIYLNFIFLYVGINKGNVLPPILSTQLGNMGGSTNQVRNFGFR